MIHDWNSRNWLQDVKKWLLAVLHDVTDSDLQTLHIAHIRPWSRVLRVNTRTGVMWFKANTLESAYEADIIRLLATRKPHSLPHLLAVHEYLPWFVTGNAGKPVVQHSQPRRALREWIDIIRSYAQLQQSSAPLAETLVQTGVADLRPQRLPFVLTTMLEQDPLHLCSSKEKRQIETLMPNLHNWCNELHCDGISPTIQHDDLHLSNVLYSQDTYRFIDWADAVIAHPFGSLLYPLRAIENVSPADSHHFGRQLMDAYLDCWPSLNHQIAQRSIKLAMSTAAIGRALTWRKVTTGVDRNKVKAYYADGFARWLKILEDDLKDASP